MKPLVEGDIKIEVARPPVFDDICVAFGINPINVYFTYGDTIYNPDNLPIPIEIIEHEKVHMEQQLAFIPPERRIKGNESEGAALWWGKYLRDPEFRIDQEARAYAKQYAVIAEIVKDRNRRFNYLRQLASSLSGPLYKSSIGFLSAISLIKKHAADLYGVK